LILKAGHWLGRGSVLIEGMSLGRTIECDARVEADEAGLVLNAELTFQDGARRTLNLRVAGNEVGTYTLRLSSAGEVFHGSAKLDSPPNLGLMWNDSETVHLTFALFAVSGGYGCRGFLRDGETTYTWEVAFSLKQDVVKGDNVISIDRRRR
jgi:hypothetical protein